MTDLETIKAMLNRQGLGYREEPHEDGIGKVEGATTDLVFNWGTEGFKGYSFFEAVLVFDGAGAIVGVQAWE